MLRAAQVFVTLGPATMLNVLELLISSDTKASQASNVIDEILELTFRMLLEGSRDIAGDAGRLAVVSRVNRHWVSSVPLRARP